MNHTSIIKSSVELDKFSTTQGKHIEIIKAFSSGDFLVHKENILSIQDTSRNNYPALLKALIKDINASSKLIIKAIIEINNSKFRDDILVKKPQLVFHSIKISKSNKDHDIIVSNTLREQLNNYVGYIDCAARNLLNYLLSSSFNDTNSQAVRHLKKLCDYNKESMNIKFLTYFNAKEIESELKTIDKNCCPSDIASYIDLFTDQQGGTRSRFHYVYFSSNLYDEKIIPKKSLYAKIDISNTEYSAKFDVIFNNGCSITNKKIKLYGDPSVDYSIEYYLKKFILEKIVNDDLFDFISVYKDFLTKERDKYILKKQPSLLNEEHPFVVDIKKDILTEKQIGKSINLYGDIYKEVQKITNYFERFVVILNREAWNDVVNQKEILTIIEDGHTKQSKYSSEEILDRARDWLYREIIKTVSNSYSLQDNGSLRNQMQRECYINRILKNTLDLCYEVQSSSKTINKTAHWRKTTFHTIMVSSYVFDFRNNHNGVFSPLVQDKILNSKDKNFEELIDVLRNNSYHDFYEFDKDIFSEHSVFDIKKLIQFFKNSAALKIPIRHKIAFKARKLKNYLALGIYFYHTKTIGIDFRESNNGISSYIHEIAHHIDLNEYFSDRENIISILYDYFYPKIKKRRKYFLSDEELIARGAEIGKLLIVSSYKECKIKYQKEPHKMIEKMKKLYTSINVGAYYMRAWDSYSERIEYIDFEDMILSEDFTMLDVLYEYFLKFWSGEKSERMSASLSSAEIGISKVKSTIDTLYPKNHFSYDYVQCDIYKITKDSFSINEYVLKYINLIEKKTLPHPSFSEEENLNHANNIKKLWSIYIKHGEPELHSKIKTLKGNKKLHFTHKMKISIIKDFANKFENDADYNKKQESLQYVFSKVYQAM